MKSLEKIFSVLMVTEELSVITLKDKPIKIHQMDLFEAISENISFYEVVQILSKLEEGKVVKKRASGYLQ